MSYGQWPTNSPRVSLGFTFTWPRANLLFIHERIIVPGSCHANRLVIAFRKIAIDRQDNVIMGADEWWWWCGQVNCKWPEGIAVGCISVWLRLSVCLVGMHGINCNQWHGRWQGENTVANMKWIESTMTFYWEIKCNKIGWSTDIGQVWRWRAVIEGAVANCGNRRLKSFWGHFGGVMGQQVWVTG